MYDYRSWPLMMSIQRIGQRFGIDVMLYQSFLDQFAVFFAILFAASFGIWLIYFLNDWVNINTFDENYNSLLQYIPYSYFRFVVNIFILILSVFYIRMMSYQRIQQQCKFNNNSFIKDCSILILNINHKVTKKQLNEFIYTHINKTNILQTLRITNPQSIYYKRKLYHVQKLYYWYLKEIETGKLKDKSDKQLYCLSQCFDKCVQPCGYRKNNNYYEKQITYYKNKIQHIEHQKHQGTQAAVITCISKSIAEQLHANLLALPKQQQLESKLIIQQAPAPNDIIYHNLQYKGVNKVVRQFFSLLVICCISLILFLLVCLCRVYSRRLSYNAPTLQQENKYYFGIFGLQLLFDTLFRPILYILTSLENHQSHSQQEAFWMIKLFVFNYLNKLTMYYSRTFMQLKNFLNNPKQFPVSFFDIYEFNSAWRNDYPDSGGQDTFCFMWIVSIIYNFLDVLEYIIYYYYLKSVTVTRMDKIKACRSYPIRYASKQVTLILVFTFVLQFGHAMPIIYLQASLYCVIQIFVNRLQLLRWSAQPPNTNTITLTTEKFMYFSVIIGAISLGQSYYKYNKNICYLIIVILVPFLILLITVSNLGTFDWFVFRQQQKATQTTRVENMQTMLQDLDDPEKYCLPVQEVTEKMIIKLKDTLTQVNTALINDESFNLD